MVPFDVTKHFREVKKDILFYKEDTSFIEAWLKVIKKDKENLVSLSLSVCMCVFILRQ